MYVRLLLSILLRGLVGSEGQEQYGYGGGGGEVVRAYRKVVSKQLNVCTYSTSLCRAFTDCKS